jgi:hypothetical protein
MRLNCLVSLDRRKKTKGRRGQKHEERIRRKEEKGNETRRRMKIKRKTLSKVGGKNNKGDKIIRCDEVICPCDLNFFPVWYGLVDITATFFVSLLSIH